MQFGIFTIGDITTDPATGITPTENQRIKDTVRVAQHAEQAGFEVFATGQHHNPRSWLRATRPPCWPIWRPPPRS